MNPHHITYLLLLHFIADFVFQDDNMAMKKSKDFGWLSIHIAAYSIVFFLGMLTGMIFYPFSFGMIWKFVLLNAGLHLLTDFFTSKLTARLWEKKERHLFFVAIGFDQFIHGITLLYTFYLLN